MSSRIRVAPGFWQAYVMADPGIVRAYNANAPLDFITMLLTLLNANNPVMSGTGSNATPVATGDLNQSQSGNGRLKL